MITIQTQNFGVEIELTGITRAKAAAVIAEYFATNNVRHIGGTYDAYGAFDRKGRIWKAMSDSSILRTRKKDGQQIPADWTYSCEIVTPILQYEDMEDLQQIVRLLVKKGAVANDSCGIHVHVDGANHDAASLTRLLNFAVGRQDLFYEALQIGERANRWCHKTNKALFLAMKNDTIKTKSSAECIWYSPANDGYSRGISHDHYNDTRYHGINLHAYFTKGTVEFRLFNGTTHAGKIKAYVQFCLAMSAWAVNCPNDNLFFKSTKNMTQEQKAALMLRVLTKRLKMRGPEFKTARLHLTSAFTQTSTAANAA